MIQRAVQKPFFLVLSIALASCTPEVSDAVLENASLPVSTPLAQDTSTFGIPWNQGVAFGRLVDPRDGWIYKTVRVGSAVWMAQNLEYRATTSGGQVSTQDAAGLCMGNSRDSCSKYGRLYTWMEAMGVSPLYAADTVGQRSKVVGICPAGWHLPSSDEWSALWQASGGVSGTASLKAVAGWSTAGSDRLGTRFLPGGHEDGGVFYDGGIAAVFWTKDEFDAVSSWNWYLYQDYGGLLRGMSGKSVRASVRCAMD